MLLVSYNDWTSGHNVKCGMSTKFPLHCCVPVAAPLIWQVGGLGLDYPPAVAVLHPTIFNLNGVQNTSIVYLRMVGPGNNINFYVFLQDHCL